MAETLKTNMVVPEVMADAIAQKMVDYMKLSPLAVINTDLVGQGGDTITVPYYEYIGDATDLAEATAGETDVLSASTTTATVKKIFKAVEISDEAMMSNFANPMVEAERQIALALASKVEADCYAVMEASTNVVDYSATASLSTDSIADAVVDAFGEDYEGVYMFITPAQYNIIRKSEDFVHIANGEVKITGQVGEVMGVKLVVSNRADATTNIMLKEGGLMVVLKRDVQVETDRDILKKTTVISADRHYTAFIHDANKVAVVKFQQ